MTESRALLRRLGLLVCAACVVVLAAPVASAGARDLPAQDRTISPRTYPALVLRGKTTVRIPWSRMPIGVYWDGTKAGNINPSLRAVYRGQTLYKLVGLVDGGPSTFNVALARRGYTILLICSDGYKVYLRSTFIIGKFGYIIARLKNGKPLPAGEGPYRFVGSFIKPFNGKLSARMITQIRLIF
jgi:hypothetical protein